MPGSRANASTRRATGSMTALVTWSAEAGDLQARGDRPHLLLGELLGRPERVVDGRDDQVLEHVDVLGIDGRRVDREPDELLLPGHGRLDDPAARGALDGGRLELGLDARHVLLH